MRLVTFKAYVMFHLLSPRHSALWPRKNMKLFTKKNLKQFTRKNKQRLFLKILKCFNF